MRHDKEHTASQKIISQHKSAIEEQEAIRGEGTHAIRGIDNSAGPNDQHSVDPGSSFFEDQVEADVEHPSEEEKQP